MRPKYWPSGASGAEIVICIVAVLPGSTCRFFGCTSIVVPGEDTALVLKLSVWLVTFLAVLVVVTSPGILGTFTEGVLRSIRVSGVPAEAT